MRPKQNLITRVALFAALVFILSYFAVFFPNINPSFFVVFLAGYLWGVRPGIGVGVIGFLLWSLLNPMGPPLYPILLAQLAGISFSAVIGAFFSKLIRPVPFSYYNLIILSISGLLCGFWFQLPVSIVDAWINQPFRERLIGGLLFSLITIISNGIIFPLLYPVLVFMHEREKRAV